MATIVGGAGADQLDGGGVLNSANDQIDGQGGNDTLLGQGGDDTLLGGEGDDSLSGGIGDDSLVGGTGDDTLEAAAGGDRLFGGSGSDRLFGNVDGATASLFGGDDGDQIRAFFNDIAHGDGGNDFIIVQFSSGRVTVFGDGGDDQIVGDETDNLLLDGGDGDDLINGGGGNDSLLGGAGSDGLNGGEGDDTLSAGSGGLNGPDRLFGAAGNDSLIGGVDADFMDGGIGDDRMFGAEGRDQLNGGDGNDTAFGGLDDDTINGGDGNDSLFGDAGADSIDGNAGNDFIDGSSGDDTLAGGVGDDSLTGGTGADRLSSGSGRNTLSGGDENDELDGRGAEFVSLMGDAGDDVLIVDGGSVDSSVTRHRIFGGDGRDTYKLVGAGDVDIDFADPRFTEALIVAGTGDLLTGIELVDLSEREGNHRVRFGAGDDFTELDIGSGRQTRDGGVGQDLVRIGGIGEGANVEIELEVGQLFVDGELQDDLIVGFEGIAFDTSLVAKIAGGSSDNIIGSAGATSRFLAGSVIEGGFGNDTIRALVEGATTIRGGVGDDLVELNRVEPDAERPNAKGTVVDGGAGNDALGYDATFTAIAGGGGDDMLLVGPEGLGSAAVNLAKARDQTLGDSVVVTGFENVDASLSLNAVRISGTAGANRLIGSNDLAAGDVISGGKGNDFLDGGLGTDTLMGGDGNDVIVLGRDTALIDGGRGRDVLIVVDDDVVVDLTNPNPQTVAGRLITVKNVEVVDSTGLAAGLNMGATGTDSDDLFRGGAGDDTYRGGKGNDTVEPGGGINDLDGGEGFDVLAFRGDVELKVDLKAVDGFGNLKQTDGLGNSLKSFEGVDATLVTRRIELKGDDGANLLAAGTGDDFIDSGLGRDTVRGGGGDDEIVYRSAAAVIDGGLGGGDTLKIVESAGLKSFNLGASDQSAGDRVAIKGFEGLDGSLSAARLAITGSARGERIVGGSGDDLISARAGDDRLAGGAGKDLLFGGDGNDTIEGGAGPDLIDGGRGDDHLIAEALGDTLTGGLGADLFEIRGGGSGGTTVIRDFDRLQGDRIVMEGAGTAAAVLSIDYDEAARVTRIDLDRDGDGAVDASVVLANLAPVLAADVVGAVPGAAVPLSGQVTPRVGVGAVALAREGTEGNDLVKGGGGLDTLRGLGGDDTVEAFGREVELDGGEGRDTLKLRGVTSRIDLSQAADQDPGPTLVLGFEDVDAAQSKVGVDLKGSVAANRLVGSVRSDTLDGGADTVAGDELFGGNGTDRLFARIGAKLIDGGNGFDTLVVVEGLTVDLSAGLRPILDRETEVRSVEAIDASQADAAVTLAGDGLANLLIGSGRDDVLSGAGGNDTVEGGGGKDILDGGLGVDLAVLDDATATVEIAIGTKDAAGDQIDAFLGIEGVDGSRLGHGIAVKGTGGANLILGTGFADTIDGGDNGEDARGLGGRDTVRAGGGDDLVRFSALSKLLDGGEGSDTLVVAEAVARIVNLAAGDQSGDRDRVKVTGFEHVDGSGSAAKLTLTGSAAANLLVGGSAGDGIAGGKGDDTLIGGLGRDTLQGGDGDDRIVLDLAEDRAAGGKGADRFVFDRFGDTPAEAGPSRILDFRAGDGDRIDLSQLHDEAGGIEAFVLLTAADQFSAAGQARIVIVDTSVGKRIGGTGLIEINLDDDPDADFTIIVDNVLALRADQFFL